MAIIKTYFDIDCKSFGEKNIGTVHFLSLQAIDLGSQPSNYVPPPQTSTVLQAD